MKKSYSPVVDSYLNIDGFSTLYLTTDVIYTSLDFGDKVVETADWKTIDTTNVPTGDGNVAVTKSIEDITADVILKNYVGETIESKKEKIFTVNLAISTGAMDAGTTLTALVKNTAGTTLETINYTFGAISEDANADFIFKPGSLVAGNQVDFTITLIDSTATYDADIVITPSEISNDVESVVFTVGTAAAASPITVACELVDIDGVAITETAIVDVFVLDTAFDPATVSTLAIGSAGTTLGDITAKGALKAITKADGTLDIAVTNTAGTVYVGVKLTNGKIFTVPCIHTA